MYKWSMWALCLLAGVCAYAQRAQACGGFFCGRLPVDQTAERIVFKVNPDSVTMITQIAYTGAAPDFAWVLPLGTVPEVQSLAVFPQRALSALDANTAPVFQLPSECQRYLEFAGAPTASADLDGAAEDSSVTVHYRAEVGPYDVAAIESTDPQALFDWLVDNDYNVSDVMRPYIAAYTSEGMKFLALKLQKDADTTDIQPFRFDLPGSSPSIPLRMTALAAEPEMGVVVFVFGDQRYGGANWPAIEIADSQIVWSQPNAGWGPVRTNWTALVARGVDEAGGQGWVTESAASTEALKNLLDNSSFVAPEDMAAGEALRALLGESPYLTRMYSRLSAEEMITDPIFRKDAGGDVSPMRQLSQYVDGVDMCPDVALSGDPCDFISCGAGGICRPVQAPSGVTGEAIVVAGCGCLAGATARTTFDPAGAVAGDSGAAPTATVVCQDARMSFVNPGDLSASGEAMPDPCLTFDCGEHGECVAMNMTPTCVCDRGYVAIGSFDSDGARVTTCLAPMVPVPSVFYAQRLPDLPSALPGGRTTKVDQTLPVVQPAMDDLSQSGGALPSDAPTQVEGEAADGGGSMPGTSDADGGDEGDGDACSVAAPGKATGHLPLGLLLGTALWLARRRRTR